MAKTAKDSRPLTYRLPGWYALVFSIVFLLYGGVTVILGFLDHQYDDLAEPIAFLAIGLVLITPTIAYRESKRWGYHGLVVINSVVVVLAIFGYRDYLNLVLLVLSAGALVALLSPATKEYLSKHG